MNNIISDFEFRMNSIYSMMESIEYEYSMRECILIENNLFNKDNIISLNESFIDKAKEFFKNIPNLISNIVNQFLESTNLIIVQDNKILEKYSDTIRNKEFKVENMKVYDYNTTMLFEKMAVNITSYDSIKDQLGSEESARKALFPNFTVEEGSDKSFKDIVKLKLRGDETEPNKLVNNDNFNSIVKFIEDYKSLKNTVKSDEKTIKSKVSIFSNIINQNKNVNESFYSEILGKNILLEEENENKDDNKSESDNDNNTSNNDNEKVASDIVNNADKEDKGGSLKDTFKRCKTATKVITDFFSAKMNVIHEAHKSYREVIDAHIKYHTNENPATGEKTEENKNDEEKPEESKEENSGENDKKNNEAKELVNDFLEKNKDGVDPNGEEVKDIRRGLFKLFGTKTNKADNIVDKVVAKVNSNKK